jgi:uncharacterized RDD family membrane protein YckC
MTLTDHYIIDTPENIEFGYEIAGIGSRFIAALLDTLLILVAEVLLTLGVVVFGEPLSNLGFSPSILIAIYTLLAFFILFGYYLVFEMLWNGQSPGKRAAGLRVVREGGRPVTFLASAIRNLVRLVDFLPTLYVAGVVSMFIDSRSRRLGDLAAGTLVVKERRGVTLESLAAPAPAAAVAPDTPALPGIERLDVRDYTLAQEFLRRRGTLAPEARARLANQIAATLQGRLELPPQGDPERFLALVVAEYQRTRRRAM